RGVLRKRFASPTRKRGSAFCFRRLTKRGDNCPRKTLPGCPKGRPPRLPDCQIARLPDCQIARLPDCQIARLPDCQIARGVCRASACEQVSANHPTALCTEAKPRVQTNATLQSIEKQGLTPLTSICLRLPLTSQRATFPRPAQPFANKPHK